jgi:peptide deformylase
MIKEIVTAEVILAQKSKPCFFTELDILANRSIIGNMVDTCEANRKECIGLAGNQIGDHKRIIVVMLEDVYTPMVNPSFTPVRSDKRKKFKEGCLSFPDRPHRVISKRWRTINITYQTVTGKVEKLKLGKMAAIIFQHEIDHLNGILI